MILHIISESAFINPFIDMLNKHFNSNEHKIMVLTFCDDCNFGIDYSNPILHKVKKCKKDFFVLYKSVKNADKIIIHGMFSTAEMLLLLIAGASKKTVCAMWGGDFYENEESGKLRFILKKYILRRCKGITCELPQDYELISKIFNTKKPYYECKLYYTIDEDVMLSSQDNGNIIKVLIGNSATKSNRHHEILSMLKDKKDKLNLVIPLSYGDDDYADRIANEAQKIYGKNVKVLRDFMPKEEYLALLDSMDVAIFYHKRQQALGNIFALLAQGKKIYLDKSVTTYKYLIEKGVYVYDADKIAHTIEEKLTETQRSTNHTKMKEICSEESLVKSWNRIFCA